MSGPTIRTPDQRLRIFVSSTLEELARERLSARAAIEKLRLQPIMFELGARPHPPRDLYRAYLDASDVFVGIYWERYGWVGPGMDISGLEDEYRSAADKPKLIYLKRPANDRDPQLTEMLARIRDAGGVSYRSFTTPDELQELIENDLALLLSEAYGGEAAGRTAHEGELPVEARLPADPTPLVGRDEEVSAIVDLLASEEVRLLTVTGPGGVGKSRLAVQVARSFEERIEVAFVALAAISSAPLVVPTIAHALDVRGSDGQPLHEALLERLSAASTLLVLDNFEQVLDAAPDIASLLERTPHLKVIVTSRAILRVRGEHEFGVAPLPFPGDGTSEGAESFPAVRLFLDRARAVRPDLKVGDADLGTIAEICSRLDGLPLAIELAAARVRVLSLQSLLDRLVDRFALLGGGSRDAPDRQRTLRDTIEWSYRLLDDDEQAVFARLGVFVAGRTLEAAEEVCDPEGELDMLGAISSLVEKSLLRREERAEGEVRFTMLESIHEFALEQLQATGRLPELQRRHAHHFLGFARAASAQLRGARGTYWIRRMAEEHGNLRSALAWSETNDRVLLLRLVASIAPFWIVRGHLEEGLGWTERALAGGHGDDRERVEVMRFEGEIYWGLGRGEQARAIYEQCRELYEALGDEEGLHLTLRGTGRIALDSGEYESAREIYETTLRLQRKAKRTRGVAESLNNLGVVESLLGKHATAVPLLEECMSLFRELDDEQGIARAALNLSVALRAMGELDRAEEHGKQSLRTWWDLGGKWDMADCLEALGSLAIDRDDRTGLMLLGAADQLRDDIGTPRSPFDEQVFQTTMVRARERFGDAVDDLFHSGRAIPLDRAIELALR